MALPPLLAGAVNAMLASVSPAVAVPMVGALGIVAGVTLLVAADAPLVPFALVALTVKVYATPLERPVTTIGDADPLVLMAPGLDVAV